MQLQDSIGVVVAVLVVISTVVAMLVLRGRSSKVGSGEAQASPAPQTQASAGPPTQTPHKDPPPTAQRTDAQETPSSDNPVPPETPPTQPPSTARGNQPSAPPTTPYLKVTEESCEQGGVNIPPNSRVAIPFENEFFKGECLFLLRTQPEDPYYREYFSTKARFFEVRFQGMFKTKPESVVFMGGEVPRKMQLGLVTKSAAKGLLSVISKLSSSTMVHYSFGHGQAADGNSGECEDMPHLAAPMWQFAERIIVTEPGETPPSIYQEFIESPESRKRFKSKKAPFALDTERTYSFSYHSKFMDVLEWKLRGFGPFGKVDLDTFWDVMPLRFVLYDIPSAAPDAPVASAKFVHHNDKKRYFLCFSIQNTVHLRQDEDEPLAVFAEDPLLDPPAVTVVPSSSSQPGPLDLERPRLYRGPSSGSSSLGAMEETVAARLDIPAYVSYYDVEARKMAPAFMVGCHVSENLDLLAVDQDRTVESGEDGRMWIVLRSMEHFRDKLGFTEQPVPSNKKVVGNVIRRRRRSIVKNSTGVVNAQAFVASNWEGQRKRLAAAFQGAEATPTTFPRTFLVPNTQADMMFMRHRSRESMGIKPKKTRKVPNLSAPSLPQPSPRSRKQTGGSTDSGSSDTRVVTLESVVLRNMWSTHWVEEWAALEVAGGIDGRPFRIVFLVGGQDASRPTMVLELKNLLGVKKCSTDPTQTHVFEIYPALELETVGMVHTLCFPTKTVRDSWFQSLKDMVNSGSPAVTKVSPMDEQSEILASPDLLDVEEVDSTEGESVGGGDNDSVHGDRQSMAVFDLVPTKRWGNQKRVILNNRRTFFNTEQRSEATQNPCAASREALRLALNLNEHSSVNEFVVFFDCVSEFKLLDLSQLDSTEKILCFFLNVYHTILLHGRLLVGQPSSVWGWGNFGSRMSYELGPRGECISLAEIEHCIVRNSMSTVKLFNILPVTMKHTAFTQQFGLRKVDPLLSFATNHMTQSESNFVVVYHESRVWDQLAAYVRTLLLDQISVDVKKKSITLPKLCSWYKNDFGGTSQAAVVTIVSFLKEPERSAYLPCASSSGKVKYAKYLWVPREQVSELKTE